jgi:hypothetical protein
MRHLSDTWAIHEHKGSIYKFMGKFMNTIPVNKDLSHLDHDDIRSAIFNSKSLPSQGYLTVQPKSHLRPLVEDQNTKVWNE